MDLFALRVRTRAPSAPRKAAPSISFSLPGVPKLSEAPAEEEESFNAAWRHTAGGGPQVADYLDAQAQKAGSGTGFSARALRSR